MSNSAFRRFGIEHLSPSSLNCWLEAPGVWAIRYLARVKDESGAAAIRGTAVEAGLLHFLHGQKNPVEAAHRTFDLNIQGELSDDIEEQRGLIEAMVTQSMLWKPPGAITASQLRIEHWFDGISVPIIGYLDFVFDTGQIVDLKTTTRCPSSPKPDHARQVALYRIARDAPAGLLYVTDKRHAYYEVDDALRDQAIGELQSAAYSLERFLSRFDDAEDAIRCLPMDQNHYRFSDAAKLKLAQLHL